MAGSAERMTYDRILPGTFLDRPNRFIAHIEINGKIETVHVKNTGRCKELLRPGVRVYVQHCPTPTRKTQYDLIAVEKGSLLINMDAQAPNKAAAEYLTRLFPDLTQLRPEVKYGDSRFDFYLETPRERRFIEVKGVTLEKDGVALFPDAPTLRGLKHVQELARCREDGYRAMVLFIIQMKGVTVFRPNNATHPEFGAALRYAARAGVDLRAVDCIVTPDSLIADKDIPVELS